MRNLRRPLLTSVVLLLIPCACLAQFTGASTDYYRHMIFDNSLTPDAYFYSKGMANGSSFLELKDDRLPVETKTFLTPPSRSAAAMAVAARTVDGKLRFMSSAFAIVCPRSRDIIFISGVSPRRPSPLTISRALCSPTAVRASKRSLLRSPSLCPWESSPATFPQDAGFRFAFRFPASIPPRYMSSGRRPSRTSSSIKVEPTAFATLC